MADELKCPFCGSKKIMIDTPFIDPITKDRQQTFCCKEMAKNYNFVDHTYGTDDSNAERPFEEAVWKSKK
jgi:hypothetical protein